jgi:OPA family glycerol-3-phosphate transporter-like MFS transporter
VKISSRWFDFSSYGTVMGILSISYLVGDAAARQIMSVMISAGFGWRALFVFAAGFLTVMLALNVVFLRESRVELGYSDPIVNPTNLFRQGDATGRLGSISALMKPLMSSPTLWVVCIVSLGTTLVRETFNTWTPTYFNGFVGLSQARSAFWSSLFPAMGAASVLATGWISDRLGATGRSAVMVGGLLIATAALLAMTRVSGGGSGVAAVTLVGVVAMGLIGPYSCLAGAMAMDFGGTRGAAASSGLIDGVGYLCSGRRRHGADRCCLRLARRVSGTGDYLPRFGGSGARSVPCASKASHLVLA